MKLTFAGASDDLIEINGPDGPDEFDVYGRGPIMWRADVISPASRPVIRVSVLLVDEDEGCWHVAAGQVDEDTPLPDWPITVRQAPDTGYATVLEIDAPDGCTLRVIEQPAR